ncbi:MAG: hypothetical protein J5527_13190 [Treponema sp.]|nr:hypothetical protein [Treponema sp.]
MSKTKRFLSGIIALSAVIFFSCNNLSNGKVISNEKPVVSNEKVTLTVAVDGMYTSAEKPGISRNIMPIDWSDTRLGKLKYVLTGSPVDVFEMTAVPATAVWDYANISATPSTAKIDLDAKEWNLTLTAYQGYTDADNPGEIALQSGVTPVDLRNGATTVTFDLLPPTTDTNATGDVDVKVIFEMPASFDHVIYGIYDGSLPTSDPVASTVTSITPITAKIVNGVVDGLTDLTGGKYSFEYKTDDSNKVKAGKYSFNATFYAKVDGVDKVICFYSDSIQIDGGNSTEKTINISKEAFNSPAVNPTSLAIDYSYNNNGLNPVELTTNTVSDKFYATFTWTDASDNETGFELVINDGTTDTTYNSSSTLVAGSLAAASSTATIELDTGKEYSAKIRATNSFTPSTAGYFSSSDRIFLFTVAYKLDGGKIKKVADSSTADSIVTYVVPCAPYTTVPSNTPDLIEKEASSVVYPYVYRDNFVFKHWYADETAKDTAYNAITIPTSGNIVLNAYWQSTLGVTITTPDYSSVSNYALVLNQDPSVLPANAAVYSVNRITNTSITLTPNTGLTGVDWKILNLAGTEITTGKTVDGATEALTWTFTGLEAGTYPVVVTGTYDGQAVTGNVYIKLTN